MTSEIEKQDKEALQEKAFGMYVGGAGINEIAEAIGRHRNTARRYIQEYADGLDPGERIFRQKVSMARLDKVIAHATDLLENGDIKDSSLTRPQLRPGQSIDGVPLHGQSAGSTNGYILS